MKINYLGTGAAERIPGIFCNCKLCKYAREKKGREIRTQTQLIIDDVLLIDFHSFFSFKSVCTSRLVVLPWVQITRMTSHSASVIVANLSFAILVKFLLHQ